MGEMTFHLYTSNFSKSFLAWHGSAPCADGVSTGVADTDDDNNDNDDDDDDDDDDDGGGVPISVGNCS